MADTQLYHVGNLLKTALNAATAGSVVDVYPYRLPYGAGQARHPCLELYREGESIVRTGTEAERIRQVRVRINYFAGFVGQDKLSDWAGYLAARVQVADDVIMAGYHVSYQSGATLEALADIETLTVEDVTYDYAESGGQTNDAHPSFALTLAMHHRYERGIADTALAGVDANVQDSPDESPTMALGELTAATSTDSGTDGVITASSKKFTSATAAFTASHVGYYISITDATNATNDGDHLITAYIDGTNVTIGNATGLANELLLNWSLNETV